LLDAEVESHHHSVQISALSCFGGFKQVQEAIRTNIVWGLTSTLGSQRSRCRNLLRLLGWSVIRQISPSSLSPCSAVKQTSARNASLLTAVARIPPRYRCAADLNISNSTRITPPNFTVSPCHPKRYSTTIESFTTGAFTDSHLLTKTK
ncbi:hypothetical protein cypCar_00023070, partial [Cyprinus carpio]